MGRRRGTKWSWKFWKVFASVATLFFAKVGGAEAAVADDGNQQQQQQAPCTPKSPTRPHLMLVSTLDGKMSALDVLNKGAIAWSVDTGTGPLLSSSISKLEIMRHGERSRLIPSLDGGLYQYNGDSVEAVPFTAETLLSSSFKLNENTVVVGGKKLCTYGINPDNGQARYICTMRGCRILGEDVSEDEDVLMVIRNTHTVRAVDSRTGAESWNFSVGQHEIRIFEGEKKVIQMDSVEDDDGISIVTCPQTGEEDGASDPVEFEGVLKVVVPRGMVFAVSKDDPDKILWSYEFPTPIANAWTLNKGLLESVNLFSDQNVPALTSSEADAEHSDLPSQPLLYVGMHHDQLYIQPSVQMQSSVSEVSGLFQGSNSDSSNGLVVRIPRVTWKPYLATAPSRTPALRLGNRGTGLPLIGNSPSTGVDEGEDSTAVAVWQDMYPYDGGFYLYPDFSPLVSLKDEEDKVQDPSNTSASESNMETISITLWNWWREVAAITVFTAILVHFLTYKFFNRPPIQDGQKIQTSSSDQKTEMWVENEKTPLEKESEDKNTEYTSRYNTDFEHVRCLGKGGFGIVFESKNKMDECPYAVKRIALTNSDTAKEKVMREVKALAKLDHSGIVRYYQAWLESPPPGWQEHKDKALEDSECMMPTPCNSVTGIHSEIRAPPYLNPFRPYEGSSHRVDIASDYSLTGGNTTEGFLPRADDSDDDDNESGSFSLGTATSRKASQISAKQNSFEIMFMNSDAETNPSASSRKWGAGDASEGDCSSSDAGVVPFHSYNRPKTKISDHAYNDESFSIVFEDSGCGDKGSNVSASLDDNSGGSTCYSNKSKHNNNNKIIHSNFEEQFMINRQKNISLHPNSLIAMEGNQSTEKKTMNLYGTPKLYLFIQMQLCQRETLKDWLNANTLNRDRHDLLDIFDQIVTAMDYVHDCGLMHRDLKPSNIFFSTDGVVKIGDFGLVTALSEQEDSNVSNMAGGDGHNHTAQVGTQLYMSPEQITGKGYGQKVDIFSLGVILFELLYPFSTQMERIKTLQNVKNLICPERFIREMHKEHKVVTWLLDHDSEKRPSTKEILNSEILKDFEVRRQVPKRLRSRTISHDSSGSG